MPKYQMEALANHEGIPRYHLERGMSQELTDNLSSEKWETTQHTQKVGDCTQGTFLKKWECIATRIPIWVPSYVIMACMSFGC